MRPLPEDETYEGLTTEAGRLRLLARVAETLLASLDYSKTLQHLSDLAVPLLADWCAVDMVTDDGRYARLAVTHTDPDKVRLAHELWARRPPKPSDTTGLPNVVRTGEPETMSDIPDSMLTSTIDDPEELRVVRGLGLRSYICVPLRSKGKVLGALSLVHAESGRRYGAEHLSIATEFARLAAVAVENAQLFRKMESALEREREARAQAETLTREVMAQSREVESLLLKMRSEKDAAERRVAELERERVG